MHHIWLEILRHVDYMGPREWFFVLAAMVGVAFVSMRGFGSRSKY
jgi:drug/metabolite transporter (DMT)-like permease